MNHVKLTYKRLASLVAKESQFRKVLIIDPASTLDLEQRLPTTRCPRHSCRSAFCLFGLWMRLMLLILCC
jgi:hypothetical protein